MDPVSPSQQSYADAVRAWADHLRAGGTTPWARWRSEGAPAVADPGASGPLPSGPQLELLRRLVELADGPVPGLDELVLTGSVPGRGPVDVPLPWEERPRFGSPPVDPADLPAEELLRVAAGALAALVSGVRLPAAEPPPPTRWPLPGRTRFRVHGPPLAARVVREDLLAAGWVESDWRPRRVVVGLPLDAMVAEHWDATTRRGGGLRWTTLWRRRQTRDDLPGVVDLPATAARAGRGGDRVDVVMGRDLADLRARAAQALGLPAPASTGTEPAVDARAADLRRRLNPLLRLAADEADRPGLARRLDHVLDPLGGPDRTDRSDHPGRAPLVPEAARAWARATGEALAADLRAADYPVHGDPGFVGELRSPTGSGGDAGTGEIDPDSTLELALTACLRAWRLQEGRD